MTYVFEFRLPNVQEGTEEADKELARLKGVSLLFLFLLLFPFYFFLGGWAGDYLRGRAGGRCGEPGDLLWGSATS